MAADGWRTFGADSELAPKLWGASRADPPMWRSANSTFAGKAAAADHGCLAGGPCQCGGACHGNSSAKATVSATSTDDPASSAGRGCSAGAGCAARLKSTGPIGARTLFGAGLRKQLLASAATPLVDWRKPSVYVAAAAAPRGPGQPPCLIPVPPGEPCPEEFRIPEVDPWLIRVTQPGPVNPCAGCPVVGTPAAPCPANCVSNGCCNFVGQLPQATAPDPGLGQSFAGAKCKPRCELCQTCVTTRDGSKAYCDPPLKPCETCGPGGAVVNVTCPNCGTCNPFAGRNGACVPPQLGPCQQCVNNTIVTVACGPGCPCPAPQSCVNGQCQCPSGAPGTPCSALCPCDTATLSNNACGANGLGQCMPNCAGKACGANGCGGSCGPCPGNQACSNGQCGCSQQPSSWPLVGLGQPCGAVWCQNCQANLVCANGICTIPQPVPCVPSCTPGPLPCGPNGCGGSCGTCQPPFVCNSGQCGCPAQPPPWPSVGLNQACGQFACQNCNPGLVCINQMCSCPIGLDPSAEADCDPAASAQCPCPNPTESCSLMKCRVFTTKYKKDTNQPQWVKCTLAELPTYLPDYPANDKLDYRAPDLDGRWIKCVCGGGGLNGCICAGNPGGCFV